MRPTLHLLLSGSLLWQSTLAAAIPVDSGPSVITLHKREPGGLLGAAVGLFEKGGKEAHAVVSSTSSAEKLAKEARMAKEAKEAKEAAERAQKARKASASSLNAPNPSLPHHDGRTPVTNTRTEVKKPVQDTARPSATRKSSNTNTNTNAHTHTQKPTTHPPVLGADARKSTLSSSSSSTGSHGSVGNHMQQQHTTAPPTVTGPKKPKLDQDGFQRVDRKKAVRNPNTPTQAPIKTENRFSPLAKLENSDRPPAAVKAATPKAGTGRDVRSATPSRTSREAAKKAITTKDKTAGETGAGAANAHKHESASGPACTLRRLRKRGYDQWVPDDGCKQKMHEKGDEAVSNLEQVHQQDTSRPALTFQQRQAAYESASNEEKVRWQREQEAKEKTEKKTAEIEAPRRTMTRGRPTEEQQMADLANSGRSGRVKPARKLPADKQVSKNDALENPEGKTNVQKEPGGTIKFPDPGAQPPREVEMTLDGRRGRSGRDGNQFQGGINAIKPPGERGEIQMEPVSGAAYDARRAEQVRDTAAMGPATTEQNVSDQSRIDHQKTPAYPPNIKGHDGHWPPASLRPDDRRAAAPAQNAYSFIPNDPDHDLTESTNSGNLEQMAAKEVKEGRAEKVVARTRNLEPTRQSELSTQWGEDQVAGRIGRHERYIERKEGDSRMNESDGEREEERRKKGTGKKRTQDTSAQQSGREGKRRAQDQSGDYSSPDVPMPDAPPQPRRSNSFDVTDPEIHPLRDFTGTTQDQNRPDRYVSQIRDAAERDGRPVAVEHDAQGRILRKVPQPALPEDEQMLSQ